MKKYLILLVLFCSLTVYADIYKDEAKKIASDRKRVTEIEKKLSTDEKECADPSKSDLSRNVVSELKIYCEARESAKSRIPDIKNLLAEYENLLKNYLEECKNIDTEDKYSQCESLDRQVATTAEKLNALKTILANSETGLKGVEEMGIVFDELEKVGCTLDIELDLCLARGLNYYTGAIFEVKALDARIGSITGGGRYDNLTGIFGLPGVSGVGISFGADRIYDVLTELDLFPKELLSATQVLFATFGRDELQYALKWAKELRARNIAVEVYPEPAKMKKQMGYADDKAIPYVAIVGGNEMETDTVMLKNMSTGEQKQVTLDELCAIQ